MVDTDFIPGCISDLGSICCRGCVRAVHMSCAIGYIWLKSRVYIELRPAFGDGNFVFAVHLAQPGLGIKAWVEV